MSLKSITLHRAASDNAGNFVDSGNDLVVGDKPDMIDADRARDILSSHGATGHYEQTKKTADKPKASTRKPAAKKTAPKSEPASASTPEPVADPGETVGATSAPADS